MSLVRAFSWLIWCTVGSLGCSRADLYPVTQNAPADDSANDTDSTAATNTADASTTGASTTDASATGASTTGASTTGASATASTTGGSPVLCPELALQPGDSNQTVLVGGMTRNYVLHIPPNYTGRDPVPLVVDFHGVGGSGMSHRSNSPYPAELDPEGVVMAFPDGLRGPAGTAWNVGPCCVADVDDVAFARALVEHAQASVCIDASRVYAVGVLTGGGMAHYLACHAADVFAAVAPAAFDLLEENVDDCQPARPVSVISFRGTAADSRVPYEGGASALVPGMPLTFLGAEGTFEAWASINGCTGPASTPDADGCSEYSGCNGGADVILCTERGGGEEPGDPSIAWPVLKRHQR
ncbi:MAG TPA: PHB depolymerase family esterase [Polyangiaceae bacterium]